MKNIYKLYFILISLVFSCSNANEEDLIDATPLPTIVTYTDNVKSIIDNNCIICHNNPPENGAPMSLLTYSDVKNAVENRGLIQRVSSNDQAFLMPFGGPRLPQALIDLIVQWEINGLLEN
ncbi:hypothetical protein A9Q86_04480 [Flavobacteriales bacterium 33_180_T64]|nr:hypothetical protein A9Q86_04480 [Flavobacteriales bacterium 33_180_T64]